jgi:hypothetical protein
MRGRNLTRFTQGVLSPMKQSSRSFTARAGIAGIMLATFLTTAGGCGNEAGQPERGSISSTKGGGDPAATGAGDAPKVEVKTAPGKKGAGPKEGRAVGDR